MGIWDDIKKGLKGSDEYRAGKAKKKAAKKTKKAKKRLSKAGVKVSKKTASKSGKIRRGAKGAKVTKGGAFPKYKKKSKAAKSFREAFSSARKAKGAGKTFTWDGRSYSTNTADDVKKSKKKSSGVGRLDRDKVAGKVKEKRPIKPKKKPTVHKTMSVDKGTVSPNNNPLTYTDEESKVASEKVREEMSQSMAQGGIVDDMKPKYEGGGKVEGGGLFSFPTKNSRKR